MDVALFYVRARVLNTERAKLSRLAAWLCAACLRSPFHKIYISKIFWMILTFLHLLAISRH